MHASHAHAHADRSRAVRIPSPPILVDPAMRELYGVIDRLAVGSLPILVLGETGVGKELVAEQLHARSPRHHRPLIRLNCAAFSEPLLEAELFGHARGAFTGADRDRPGLLAATEGGTVFLDEIGELPLAIQAKLLRVLENGEVLPVGAVRPVAIDVRFVSATNVDLAAAVGRHQFRADLFHRLSGATLVVPPLRARPSELRPLARHFVARVAQRLGLAAPELAEPALAWIEQQPWRGNARELRNAIERAVLLAGAGPIELVHLPAAGAASPSPSPPEADPGAADPARRATLDALARCHGNQTRAAALLGIARSTLVKRLDAYGAPRPRKHLAR